MSSYRVATTPLLDAAPEGLRSSRFLPSWTHRPRCSGGGTGGFERAQPFDSLQEGTIFLAASRSSAYRPERGS